MNYTQDIKPISYLKSNTASVIQAINETQRAIIITQNGEAKAVIQDILSYERLQNAISLLRLLLQSEQEVKKGQLIPQDKVFEELESEIFGK